MDSKDNKENLEPHEADKRMENMAKLSKEPEHAFEIEKLRAENKKDVEKNEDDRNKSKLYHSMGQRAGLHQKSVHDVDRIYEEKNIRVTHKRFIFAKGIYQEHGNTAAKNFSNSKLRGLLKHEFEEEKETTVKKDVSLSKQFNKDIDMDK
ncbi:hypothetical protein [Kordia sp.]|uniref:hypothetical protein n=1 Tax=Kordia sp. TaxID=1965332 RepID=UPI003D6BC150